MNKFLLLMFVLLSPTNGKKFYKLHGYEAYYWKDFGTTVPSDALIAGRSEDGEPVYVVQVLHKSFLIPGQLDKDKQNALYEYDNTAWSSTKNVKILCTNFPNLFEWYTTDHSTFINDKNYIIGGYETERTVYIGRGNGDGDVLVGKVVFSKEDDSVYLHTTYKEKPLRLKNYQVLQFTPLYVDYYTISKLLPRTNPPKDELYIYDAYYWRDFRDTVPFDAYSSGKDKNGESVYIVQVLHEDILIPGYLDIQQKQAVYEYGMQQCRSSQFKILCSHYPQYLVWQKPTRSLFSSSNSQNVIGGYEQNNTIYIGRGMKDHQFVVGKITAGKNGKPSLLHGVFDEESVRLKFFKVLGYQLWNENATTTFPITVRIAESNNTTTVTEATDTVSEIPQKNILNLNLSNKRHLSLNTPIVDNFTDGQRYYFINIY